MSLYLALKKLEDAKDEQLEVKVNTYLSPSSPSQLIKSVYTGETTLSATVDHLFNQERDKQYTWRSCIPFQSKEDTTKNELMYLLALPLLTKQDFIGFVHKQSVFFTGLLGIITYLSGAPLIPTTVTSLLMLWIIPSTYRDVLLAPMSLLQYEDEAKARAHYLDDILSKRIKNP